MPEATGAGAGAGMLGVSSGRDVGQETQRVNYHVAASNSCSPRSGNASIPVGALGAEPEANKSASSPGDVGESGHDQSLEYRPARARGISPRAARSLAR
jgi:hypothetical protein